MRHGTPKISESELRGFAFFVGKEQSAGAAHLTLEGFLLHARESPRAWISADTSRLCPSMPTPPMSPEPRSSHSRIIRARSGCEVTAISMTRSKEKEARSFGAAHFIAAGEEGALRAAERRFDFILSTVPADLPWPEYLATLRPEGTFCIAGLPQSDIRFPALALIDSERRFVGGRTGSPADIATMLRFAAHNGVKAQIEKFPMNEANRALDRVRSGEARYRVVLEG
jgi:Zinc-binding dehydrogenase